MNKVLAGDLKEFLEKYGLSVFLAHEDINPTIDWQEEIVRNLKVCNIFIPILTKEFRESEWTDQETGMAQAFNKLIIPLKVSRNPYGFIGRIQACNIDDKNIESSFPKIISVIKDNSPFRKSLVDCLLRQLDNAGSFNEASWVIKELEKFETFTKEQCNEIIRISIKNNQVRMCRDGKTFLKSIIKKHDSKIDPLLKDAYDKMKDEFSNPILF